MPFAGFFLLHSVFRCVLILYYGYILCVCLGEGDTTPTTTSLDGK